jgi:hypothetical protein
MLDSRDYLPDARSSRLIKLDTGRGIGFWNAGKRLSSRCVIAVSHGSADQKVSLED